MKIFLKWVAGIAAGIVAVILLIVFITWEINQMIATNKAKMVQEAKAAVTQARIDSTAKAAGRLIFEVKSFKKKVGTEVKRLQDSTEAK